MRFNSTSPNRSLSDCGLYEIRGAMTNGSVKFYNAWHLPTAKHLEASSDQAKVRAACERHAQNSTQVLVGGGAHA